MADRDAPLRSRADPGRLPGVPWTTERLIHVEHAGMEGSWTTLMRRSARAAPTRASMCPTFLRMSYIGDATRIQCMWQG